MRKVLILDIDGVLALEAQWGKDKYTPCGVESYHFSDYCVKILNQILQETEAEIILSSDWKLFYDLPALKCLFRHFGVNGAPVALTPNLEIEKKKMSEVIGARKRAEEIKSWLGHNEEVKFVIVDDLPLEEWFDESVFVRCKYSREGIGQTGIKEKIINILNYAG
jgi:hypothetical protein